MTARACRLRVLIIAIIAVLPVGVTGTRCDAADATTPAVSPPALDTAMHIVDQPFRRTLFGKSGHHDPAHPYGGEIIALLDQVWPAVKKPGFTTTGINHVIYGQDDSLFAGVEVTDGDALAAGLEKREVVLPRYASLMHVGPYAGLPQAWKSAEAEIARRGLTRSGPALEIYGHWNADESKLETEILIPLGEGPAKTP